MPDTDLIALANKFAADAAKRDSAAMGRLVRAYLSMYRRLAGQIEALAEQVGSNQMTTGQLARLGRYNSLMRQIESELTDFAAYTKIELSASADEAVRRALADARSLIYAGAGGTLEVGFNALPAPAVTRLLGFLQDGSPLYTRLSKLAPMNSAAIRDLFVEGVGLGWNPRKIAAAMRRQFGMGLVDALRFTRTANNYAYRESTRATYIANKDVVTGWIWLAAINNPNTCMSCIRMHGTKHPNTERLNDHHNGRCTMLPIVKGFENPIKQTGEEWFNEQSESDQRAIMGRDYHRAWKDGLYSFDEISMERKNDVYGNMRGVTPLWKLLGAEPPLRTR